MDFYNIFYIGIMTIYSPERQVTWTQEVIYWLDWDVEAAILDSNVLDALWISAQVSVVESLSPEEARRILWNSAI